MINWCINKRLERDKQDKSLDKDKIYKRSSLKREIYAYVAYGFHASKMSFIGLKIELDRPSNPESTQKYG